MTRTSVRLSVCLLLICCSLPLIVEPEASADRVVPALVKFTGTLNDINGQPLTATVGVTFLLYKRASRRRPSMDGDPERAARQERALLHPVGIGNQPRNSRRSLHAGEARWLGAQPSGQRINAGKPGSIR